MTILTDPIALEANRRGELTPGQVERLKGTGNSAWGFVLILLYFVIPVASIPLMTTFISFIPVGLVTAVISLVSAFQLGKYVDRQNKERIQQELAAKEIRQAEGEIEFGWLGYRIRLPERRVGLERDREGLLPGVKYRFYYLPLTSLLLSAEPLSPLDEAQVQESLLNILARTNRFSLSMLNANRQGRLAPLQVLVQLSALRPVWLFLLMVLYLGFRVYQSQLAYYPEPAMRPVLLTGPFVIIATFAGLLLLGIVFYTREALMDLGSGRVETVEGIGQGVAVAKPRTRTDKEGNTRTSTKWSYYYDIGKKRFRVSKRAYEALIDGRLYRLYYTPRYHLVLSIEPLPVSAIKEAKIL